MITSSSHPSLGLRLASFDLNQVDATKFSLPINQQQLLEDSSDPLTLKDSEYYKRRNLKPKTQLGSARLGLDYSAQLIKQQHLGSAL